ncbi:ankyrin repeat domain-containing protein [Roseateles oligotrophus]|uniref:Ankyrin repeat domain-containing protein n=1 Tax=Roseateles oligotrophus TaxID=1769250 RepID=A0ABT2YFW7_9BURK|nr:ankyrin repeat domain-containing protein [Roseateles oligotrophus]MCV2368962.1 ankyrin repeat domain-containing protein [Roseateles oligotrophus]
MRKLGMLGPHGFGFGLVFGLAMVGACRAAPIDDLVMAAELDNGYVLSKLLQGGVDPNARDARGRLALSMALREDSDKALDSLLAYPKLDINAVNANGETALMLAAIKGRLDWVQKIVKKGATINTAGWTALHYAASGPDNGVSAWLLSQGADINARSPNGSTALMMSARYGALDLPSVLLKAGADVNLANDKGLSAADFAATAGRDELKAKLLKLMAKSGG